jgi:predicted DNA binding CopG/RHH family protein
MRKKQEPLPLPDFASEEEEIAFWDTHHPADYFTEPADLIIDLQRSRKKMVSVRIEEELQDDLKQIAGKHGIPYQRLMRELIRRGVAELKGQEADARRANRRRQPAATT